MPTKYTCDLLKPLVASSTTVTQVLHKLGLKSTGSMHRHISALLKKYGLRLKGKRPKRINPYSYPDLFDPSILSSVLSESTSTSEVLRKFGLDPKIGNNRRVLRCLIENQGLSIEHFTLCATDSSKLSPNKILVCNRLPRREHSRILRRAMLEFGFEHSCSICGQESNWRGSTLTLEIDHINGNGYDNTPNNIRFLCPNCHSQTSNYAGRGSSHVVKQRVGGALPKGFNSKSLDFSGRAKGTWPSDDELRSIIWGEPAIHLASKIGVTSTALKRYCKRRGIETPPRGYWSKKSSPP